MFLNFKISGINLAQVWKVTVNTNLIIQHIYLIGNIHSDSFNGVIWSLIHELRISLIFPFVVLILKRINWKVSILACFLLTCVSILNKLLHFQNSNGFLITYFDTLHYLSVFILGSLLAMHRNVVISYYQTLTTNIKILFLVVSVLAYNFSWVITYFLYHFTGYGFLIIEEYGMALGAIGFFITALGSTRVINILLQKPFSFLGKISYSLYLYHFPILLACIYLFYGTLSLWLICIIAIFLGILVSFFAWYLIEEPCRKIGQKLATKIKDRQRSRKDGKKVEVYYQLESRQ
jgi:peptidoglycan/LPS O-acetylase OafA/YrhL